MCIYLIYIYSNLLAIELFSTSVHVQHFSVEVSKDPNLPAVFHHPGFLPKCLAPHNKKSEAMQKFRAKSFSKILKQVMTVQNMSHRVFGSLQLFQTTTLSRRLCGDDAPTIPVTSEREVITIHSIYIPFYAHYIHHIP